jgi:hypothetical protein
MSRLLEAEKASKNKRHFANGYLGATRGGHHSPERLCRLQAVTTIWFTSMIVPSFFMNIRETWNGMSGTHAAKLKMFALLKTIWIGATDKDVVSYELYK